MPSEPSADSTQSQQRSNCTTSNPFPQDGFHQLHPECTAHDSVPRRARSASPQSVYSSHDASGNSVIIRNELDESLRRMSVGQQGARPKATLGQRIADYENALTQSTPRQAMGFKVIRRGDAATDGVQLLDFPNEILTHILSHLHPDSHASVALASKRLYALVTTPHAWRIAFQRYFPGQDALIHKTTGALDEDGSEFIRSETRYFNRLTAHASWRSEYLLRTRLLRSLARGKPGSTSTVGSSTRTSQTGKKASAVLTYNTKLPSMVTKMHATFVSSGKKPPRVIHACGNMCVGSASDPTSGKVEKWGLDDPFAFAQLDEVFPQILPYGIGEGPAAVPNVMDVSQPFGVVGGEGFPGGRVFYRPSGEFRGKYLGQEPSIIEAHPDIPKIPELSDGVCSVWIAKSMTVPSLTQFMVGIMTGSILGIVTAYALGFDPSGPRYANGEITARWVLSPGVPIIAIRVDESYSQKRKAYGRVWAVALNALGEVFYLTHPPTPPASKTKAEYSTKTAWYAGRSTYWHLVDATCRQAREDESGKNAIRGAYSPRSPSDDMNLKCDQMAAEAREIEKFLKYKPAHFRKVCYGWDMRRRLEVDFAGDDRHGAGESIFVINCGIDEEQSPSIMRFTRDTARRNLLGASVDLSPTLSAEERAATSLFGDGNTMSPSPKISASPFLKQVMGSGGQSLRPEDKNLRGGSDEWYKTSFALKDHSHVQINVSSIDMSLYGLMTSFEDPLTASTGGSSAPSSPTSQSPSDVPGRRARLLGIGTNSGLIILWNMRQGHTSNGVFPLRVIQTESPEVSTLALSALYLVHGGSDGLVQAWDSLGSTLDPVRTINSRSLGRVPRHMIAVNPALRNTNFSAVGAIFLDPDPTVLRGIVAFGTFVRYWAYSSSGQQAGRKRRLRHSDIHGRLSSRRHGGGVKGYIAAEAEELRRDQETKARDQARLRSRFGVGLGDLNEEEAVRYAKLISQESFLQNEQRRTSASDTGSAADFDTSTVGSMDTVTPDPSVAGLNPPTADPNTTINATDSESDYELEIQQAIRLSLMEGVNDMGQSTRGNSSGDYDFVKEKRGQRSSSSSPPSTAVVPWTKSSLAMIDNGTEDDLEHALRLSLAEAESRKPDETGLGFQNDEFPMLGVMGSGKASGKGKGKAVW